MTFSKAWCWDTSLNGEVAYTVICKSGQRGREFTDPRLAALAFLRTRDQDRPFVLRHRGGTSYVIASAKTGAKRIEGDSMDDLFTAAYASLAS
jgi:hypothetical protein